MRGAQELIFAAVVFFRFLFFDSLKWIRACRRNEHFEQIASKQAISTSIAFVECKFFITGKLLLYTIAAQFSDERIEIHFTDKVKSIVRAPTSNLFWSAWHSFAEQLQESILGETFFLHSLVAR